MWGLYRACPISLPNEFDHGLSKKGIYKYYPQAIPNAYVIDKEGSEDIKVALTVVNVKSL